MRSTIVLPSAQLSPSVVKGRFAVGIKAFSVRCCGVRVDACDGRVAGSELANPQRSVRATRVPVWTGETLVAGVVMDGIHQLVMRQADRIRYRSTDVRPRIDALHHQEELRVGVVHSMPRPLSCRLPLVPRGRGLAANFIIARPARFVIEISA